MRDGEKRGQVGAAMRDTTMTSAFSERGCSGLSHRTGLLKYGKRNWVSLVCEATHRWRPNESLSTDQIAEGCSRRSERRRSGVTKQTTGQKHRIRLMWNVIAAVVPFARPQ
jgi:hypothetical protein